jgi:hypothetical protein
LLDVAEIVPQAAPLHPAPLNVQVTPRFAESFVTVAVTFWPCEDPACAESVVGETETTGTAAVIVIFTEVVATGVATVVAVRVTVGGLGTAAGGV